MQNRMETKNPETQMMRATQIEASQKKFEDGNPQEKNFARCDIFDKIMSLPFLRIFEPFYKKYKMALLYLFRWTRVFPEFFSFHRHRQIHINRSFRQQRDLLGRLCVLPIFHEPHLGVRWQS